MLDAQSSDNTKNTNSPAPAAPDFSREFEPTQARPLTPLSPGNDSQADKNDTANPGQDDTRFKFLSELMRDPELLNKTINTFYRKVDADGDGHVTEKEAASGAFLNDKERILQDLLKNGGDVIQKQNNDEWGEENDGASKQDIKDAFKNWMTGLHDEESASRVTNFLPAVFERMDRDGDGFLKGEELEESNVPETGNFATDLWRGLAALELRENYDKIKDYANDGRDNNLGISLSDIYASTDSFYKNQTQEQKDLNKYFMEIANQPLR